MPPRCIKKKRRHHFNFLPRHTKITQRKTEPKKSTESNQIKFWNPEGCMTWWLQKRKKRKNGGTRRDVAHIPIRVEFMIFWSKYFTIIIIIFNSSATHEIFFLLIHTALPTIDWKYISLIIICRRYTSNFQSSSVSTLWLLCVLSAIQVLEHILNNIYQIIYWRLSAYLSSSSMIFGQN